MVSSEGYRQKDSMKEPLKQAADNSESDSNKFQMTEEQKARMEANRLKALERIATRVHSSSAP